MTLYEYYEERKKHCLEQAAAANNVDIKIFYVNAAAGYELKQTRLTVREAGQSI